MTLHDLVNVFDDRSELSEINRMAGRQDVTVNPNTFRLLVHAERARLKTGGSFHAGLLPAIQIWRKAKETQRLPSHFELRKTSHIIKKSELILNPEKHTVFLKKTGQGIDLGGIAKGYAIDRTVEVLRKRNVPEALLNFGAYSRSAEKAKCTGSPPEFRRDHICTWRNMSDRDSESICEDGLLYRQPSDSGSGCGNLRHLRTLFRTGRHPVPSYY